MACWLLGVRFELLDVYFVFGWGDIKIFKMGTWASSMYLFFVPCSSSNSNAAVFIGWILAC